MIVFCIGDTRSGTTAIARCFRDAETFVNLGEVFYNSSDGAGHYIKRWEKTDPPSLEKFVEYLDFLRSDTEHLYWLDIKFHDLNRFDPLQRAVLGQPTMVQQIVKAGDPTVLIGRANPLLAANSELQAITSGTFHVAELDNLEDTPVESSIDRFKTVTAIRTALQRNAELRAVEEHLRMHPRLLRVDYEALFDCPEAEDNRANLGAWIGVDTVSMPDLRKVSHGWPEWFDRDLAAQILQGTSGQWWVS